MRLEVRCGSDSEDASMSAARPLHAAQRTNAEVSFIICVGPTAALPWAVWYGRREEALTCENPIFYGLSSVLLHAMCSRGVQQVKGDATHIFVADFVRRREVKERPGTLPGLWVPPLLQHQRTQKVVPVRKRSRLGRRHSTAARELAKGRPLLSSCLPGIWIKHNPSIRYRTKTS